MFVTIAGICVRRSIRVGFNFCYDRVERRVRVELERPPGNLSRTRDSGTLKGPRNAQVPVVTQESTDMTAKKPALAGLVPSQKWIEVSSDSDSSSRKRIAGYPDSRYAVNHPYYRYQNLLTTLCNPPQVVFNSSKNQIDVVHSSIPPAPQALIFCCSNTMYGNRFGLYDKLWMKKEW